MNRTPREEREAAEAEWLHENRESLREDAENAEEVDFEVARPLAVTTSFRLSPDEAETIREAARTSGLSQSEWIRAVCIAAANHEQAPVTGINAREARKLRGLLEQAEQIVAPATRAS